MHVENIDIFVEKRRAFMRAIVIVAITNESGCPVEARNSSAIVVLKYPNLYLLTWKSTTRFQRLQKS